MICRKCASESTYDSLYCPKCGANLQVNKSNKFLRMLLIIPVILTLLVVIFYASVHLKDEHSKKIRDHDTVQDELSKRIRDIDTVSSISDDYFALWGVYRGRGYLEFDEKKKLERVMDKAHDAQSDYLYGTLDYSMLQDCQKDFTNRFEMSLPSNEMSRLETPDGVDKSSLEERAVLLLRYDILRSKSARGALNKTELKQLFTDMRSFEHSSDTDSQFNYQLEEMMKHFYDK